MKRNLKLSLLLALLAVSGTTMPSCKKYSENPAIVLTSRKERVTNTWKVEHYSKNSTDYTSLMSDYTETYTKSNGYSYKWGNLYNTGSWNFQSKDEEIQLSGGDAQSSRTLTILKLEEKSFWYYFMDGSDKHEYHLIPN
ncbi:MAG: hypothetical protein ACJ75J_00165 [Cytophagaceae bacterium]